MCGRITKCLQSNGRLKGACVEAESAASSPNRGHLGPFDSSQRGPSFSDLSSRWEAFISLSWTQEPTHDQGLKLDKSLECVWASKLGVCNSLLLLLLWSLSFVFDRKKMTETILNRIIQELWARVTQHMFWKNKISNNRWSKTEPDELLWAGDPIRSCSATSKEHQGGWWTLHKCVTVSLSRFCRGQNRIAVLQTYVTYRTKTQNHKQKHFIRKQWNISQTVEVNVRVNKLSKANNCYK